MRTLAIGDIHGCFRALQAVLQAAAVTPEDRLVFLGDYIDRGPDSKAVLEWLIQEKQRRSLVALRGNHESMLLLARTNQVPFDHWLAYGGEQFLQSYGTGLEPGWQERIPPSHWDFVAQTLPWFETGTHLFVHGSLAAGNEMPEQPEWLLYWERFDPALHHKSGKQIICGHTRQKSGWPAVGTHSVCIDTAACAGLWLTCLDVDSGVFWQANENAETRAGNLQAIAS